MTTHPEHTGHADGPLSRNHRGLDNTQRRKVLDAVAAGGLTCARCGDRRFAVGDGLEMGTVWPGEDLGTYLIALTCEHCATRSGVRLRESEFLAGPAEATAARPAPRAA
ncbi:MAG: hypothetical protein ACRDRL_23395 [Sciscionella sp.]